MSNEDSNGHLYNVPLSSDSEPGDNMEKIKLSWNRKIQKMKDLLEQHIRMESLETLKCHFLFPSLVLTRMTGIHVACLDPDINPDEEEEKQRLITQVLELQNTLDDLSSRVDTVKEENLKLKSENQVLGQYIENLMAASSVFQSTSPKSKKK